MIMDYEKCQMFSTDLKGMVKPAGEHSPTPPRGLLALACLIHLLADSKLTANRSF